MDELEALKDKPRSERISVLFDWSPFNYQTELIDGATKEVYKAAVKPGRQVGKTETGGAIGAERALVGHDVMILGPFQDTVKEMMEAAKGHLLNAEEKFSQAGFSLGTEKRNQFEWDFQNGGRLRARTVGSDGTQIRGKNPDIVLVDEAAYIKDSIFTEVIEPFFSTHDSYEFYLFSTPAGKSGYFYTKVVNDDGFYSPHWPSKISPLIESDFLESKRKELDSQTFAQEYLGEFVESADSYLPHDIVRPNIDPDVHRKRDLPRWLGVDPSERGDDRLVIVDIDSRGMVHNIWSKQTVKGPDFVGLLKTLQTTQTPPEPDWGTKAMPPQAQGYEKIIVESNMAGLATDIAQEGLGSVIMPVKSTRKSKGPMYKRLKRDLEANELTLPNYTRLIQEITSLQYSYTANGHLKLSHPNGGHDDYPDALMLANAGRTGIAREYKAKQSGKQTDVPLAW